MINSISIRNFRCYGNSSIEGFKRINLIGGLNNSGKTVLLEAILLACSPSEANIITIKQARGNKEERIEFPEYYWDDFFFNQDKNLYPTLKIDEDLYGLIQTSLRHEKNAELEQSFSREWRMRPFSSTEPMQTSTLQVLQDFLGLVNGKREIALLAHLRGVVARETGTINHFAAHYISSFFRKTPALLAQDYGIAEKKGNEELVLQALQIIDKDIERIRVSVVGGAHIEIKRKDKAFMAAGLFGDAINKILNIVLNLVNNIGSVHDPSVLLIDEIENGIHHTTQKDFWHFIFRLAESFGIQIFATTHSLEMLQAFAKAATEQENADCAYIELFRRASTGEIDYNAHSIETLNFELANKMPLRGE